MRHIPQQTIQSHSVRQIQVCRRFVQQNERRLLGKGASHKGALPLSIAQSAQSPPFVALQSALKQRIMYRGSILVL